MFNLSRYFSTVSFILIVLAAGVFGPLYRQLSQQQIGSLAESRNVAMAHLFEEALRQPLEQLLVASLGRDAESLRQSAEVAALRERLAALTRNTALVQLRLYNRLGVVVFATDSAQIGETGSSGPDFRAALAGTIGSKLQRHVPVVTFGGEPAKPHALISHVPVVDRQGAVEGVFELYQDVTPFMQQLQRSERWVTAGVFAVFAVLFLMQYLVVRRAQGVLTEQERNLKAVRDTLELQVEARTEELKRTNLQLQDEIGERRQAESKLNYLACHDPLTGLANRRYFIERLGARLGETGDGQQQLAVLFIDLDQFKQVNDSLGHGVGDELLISVTARLTEQLHLVDMLARLGGDEFICLMEQVRNEDEVAIVAGEIVDTFAQPFRLGDHELFLSASVGISMFPGDGATVVELMRNADTAMYRAKAIGRGEFCFYAPEMTRDAQERIRVENLLRRALDRQEFIVYLQPQVDTASGRLVGAEALLRWRSAELGLVLPNLFIPLAEDSGVIVPLGAWVLRETCCQVRRWDESGFALPMVSVNVSVRQLERPEFADMLRAILKETGMNPARLKLELTESVLMGIGNPRGELQRLRALGVSLALDDFGTGYSSLNYLRQLPVQQLKIDRSFITGIGHNGGDEAIIRTVMQLAASLGFEVVAEGVETPEQADFLATLGCQQLQGELHGAAMAPAEFRSRWGEHA
ncbi:MAG: EAL domain-containing protein [Azonexus sp.]|jgi:diguanylate cyclase (GGDEF)-like protein|uniref:putative bifunctional diguanylate cyclase/phosphodiesterase n=1 Tax=Azonexus sp. TaxID=1872668 RepID=UPI002833E4CA|nr:EAL domain-containing protein [Azonexus sp.]MDR0776814.1 EAL domain-containing protein [Azonexus sp.]